MVAMVFAMSSARLRIRFSNLIEAQALETATELVVGSVAYAVGPAYVGQCGGLSCQQLAIDFLRRLLSCIQAVQARVAPLWIAGYCDASRREYVFCHSHSFDDLADGPAVVLAEGRALDAGELC